MAQPGDRVELTAPMENDPAPIEVGARGTIAYIDDGGTLHIDWDNGRTLGLLPGQDRFRILP